MERSISKSAQSQRHGQALIPVLFVMLILTVVAVYLATSAARELKASSNYTERTVRLAAAQGAVNYAMSSLAQSSNNGCTYGIVTQSPDTDANGWMPIGDAWVKIEAVDTGSCLSLNSATAAILNRLPVFQSNPDLAAAIVDWRTPGDQPSANGAKSEYYNTLPQPYDCKSAPFDTVDELLLVKGITPDILYGTAGGNPIDTSAEILSSPGSPQLGGGGEPGGGLTRQAAPRPGAGGGQTGGSGGQTGGGGGQAGGSGGQTGGSGGSANGGIAAAGAGDTDWSDTFSSSTLALAEMFTTVAHERNVAADGTARVNINTATAQDLQTKLGLAPNLARQLVRFRNPPAAGGGGQGGGGNGGGGNGGGGGGGGQRPGGGQGGGGHGGGQGGGGQRPGGGQGGGGNGGGQGGGGQRPGGGGGQGPAAPRGAQPLTLPGFRQAAGGQGGGQGSGGQGGSGGSASATVVFKTLADLLYVPGFTRTVMQSIADKIAIDDKPYRENVVNINTAPSEVLALVPGMDHTTLNAIVQYRQGGQAFQTLGDLFTLQDMQRQNFINVIAHLTAKTSTYRIRVRVRSSSQSAPVAVSALVELTDSGPQIIQWREVSRTPGWSTWTAPVTLPAPTGTSDTSGSTSGGTSTTP